MKVYGRTIWRLFVAFVISLPAVLVGGAAHANPLDAFGFGAKASSLGGAVTALISDFSANYYNPAGLAADDNLRIELGYTYVEPFLRFNEHETGVDPVRGIQGGIVLPAEVFSRTLAFSVALFLPDERVTRLRALPQSQPRFVVYDNRPQRVVITTSAALEILEGLYVGAGLTYLTNTKGTLDMQGAVSGSDAEDTALFTGIDVALESVRYPSFGIRYDLTDEWSFGIAYRHDFSLALELEVLVNGDIYLGDAKIDEGTLTVLAADHNLFSPRQIVAGVAHTNESWGASFDFGWLDWSEFPAPTAQISLDVDLTKIPVELPGNTEAAAPEFHDIFVARLGMFWTLLRSEHVRLEGRSGYFFEPSPAPPQTGDTNFVDSDKHGISLGIGAEFEKFSAVFPKPITLDFSALYIHMVDHVVEKNNPADPVGDYRASGDILGLTLSAGFLF